MGSYGITRKRKSDQKVMIASVKADKVKKEPTTKKVVASAAKKASTKKPKAE